MGSKFVHSVFGPVPSRRLGRSLGIDTVPMKTCNWNCVYCQLGRSKPMVKERKSWIPSGSIVEEVHNAIRTRSGTFDWITFVGSGEDTLHSEIGSIAQQVKAISPVPVAFITNGSTLYLDDVRNGLAALDAVMPTLDAGNEKLYLRMARPVKEASFKRHMEGLLAFSKMNRTAKLNIEVMLVSELNDTEEELESLAGRMEEIQPDAIHLMLPTRCPTETWVKVPSDEALIRAQAILGAKASLMASSELTLSLAASENLKQDVTDIVTRHPLRMDDLIRALPFPTEEASFTFLETLAAHQSIMIVERLGIPFVKGMRSILRATPGTPQR